jgi:hypothetical protein
VNYDLAIQEIIDVIKADKSLAQPYKNFAVSDGLRWKAVVAAARNTTNREAPDDLPIMQFAGPECICTEFGKRKDCPVHGIKA